MPADIDFHIGHRDRLRQKFLDGHLADYEKLELLLAYVIPRRDVRPLARGLMQKFGSINQVLAASLDALVAYKGVGRNTAIFLKLIHSILCDGYKHELKDKPVFHNRVIFDNYCKTQMAGKMVEEFHILYLDNNRRLLDDWLHSTGTIDWSAVYPREILRRGLELNARFVILLHNHPVSGKGPSTEDIEMTDELTEYLAHADIILDDHYVVSNGILFSARDLSLLKK